MGVVWLASHELNYHLALLPHSMLHTNMAILAPDKHVAWSMHNLKHKIHPKGMKISGPAFSSSNCLRASDLL